MSTHNLSVVLTGNNTSLKSVLMASGQQVDTFSKRVEQAGRSGETAGKLMKAALVVGVFAVAAAMAYGVVQAAAFDREMRNVQSITKVSDAELQRMGKTVVHLSTTLPQSAKTLAEGLYDIASSGFQGAAGMQVLEASAEAASAGLTTTEVSARAITAVLNAYGKEASEARDVSDILFQTVNVGVISFESLATELGDVVGLAAVLTVGIDEVGSAIAAMTLSGISGAESATALNRTMQALSDPTEELSAALQAVGYESGVQALEVDSLSTVMEKLRVQSGGNIEVLQKWFPEIRAMKGALALMANEGRNYAKVVGEIESEEARAGATRAALAEQMKAASAQWQLFINKVNAGAITMGSALLPVVILTLGALTDLTKSGIEVVGTAIQHLQPFIDALTQVWGDMVEITGDLTESLGPAGAALAGLVGYGVIQALNLLGRGLALVTGLLSDHPGAVKAVAVVLGGIYLGSLIRTAAATLANVTATEAWIAAWLGKGVHMFSVVGRGFQALAVGLWEMVQVGGSFSGGLATMKSGLSGLGGALASPTVAAGVLGLALVSMALSWTDAGRKAKEAREEIEKDIDFSAPDSIVKGIDRTKEALDEAKREWHDYDGVMGTVKGTLDVISFGALGEDVDGNARKVNELTDAWYDQQGALAMINEKYSVVGTRLGISAKAVEMYAREVEGLDPATATYDELAAAIETTATVTEKGTPKQQAMADAMATVASDTSDAADELGAFKDAIDKLLGVEVTWFEAQTKSREAMDGFKQTIKDTVAAGVPIIGLFDSMTEGGRNNRDAIAGVVDSWASMASSLAAKGDIEGAVGLLKGLEWELRGVLEQAGMAPESIDALVTSLGLVPGNYEALLTLKGQEEASAGLQTLIDGLAGVDGTTASADLTFIDATGESRATIDAWILHYATSDPTTRIYVDKKPAEASQQALDEWTRKYEDSDPKAIALMSILDPTNKFGTLSNYAANWRSSNPTTSANVNIVAAEAALARLRYMIDTMPKTINVTTNVTGVRPNRTDQRWGGLVYAAAAGGITPAHITKQEQIKYGEPETGGEAFVPRLGDARRSTQVLTEAAGWYGYGLVKMAKGGHYMAPGAQGTWSQPNSEYATMGSPPPAEVRVILETAGADRHLVEMFRKMVRVEGAGNVQVALGQGGR